MVMLVAFGLKNVPLTPPAANVKSGVTPPGSEPKPVVARRSDPGVLVGRLPGNVKVLMLPSLFAVTVKPLVNVSLEKLSNISMNCTLPLELVKISLTCQRWNAALADGVKPATRRKT